MDGYTTVSLDHESFYNICLIHYSVNFLSQQMCANDAQAAMCKTSVQMIASVLCVKQMCANDGISIMCKKMCANDGISIMC